MSTTQNRKPSVAIIVLNWNGKDDTLECLSSLFEIDYPNFSIIVVDNGSSDDSVVAISSRYPNATLLETRANLGYAGGNNVGINFALVNGADFVLLINNDTVVSRDIVSVFVDAAASYIDAGIFGAKIFYYSKPDVIWALGGKWESSVSELTHIGQGVNKDEDTFIEPMDVDYAIGCALFVRKEVIEKIGLLDPDYFLNFEENDWCCRARRAGFKILAIPRANLWHKVSASFGGEESPLWKYFMTRNELLWARKNLPLLQRFAIAKKLIGQLFPWFEFPDRKHSRMIQVKEIYWGLRQYLSVCMARIRDPYYLAQIYGLLDYFVGRFGDCRPYVRSRIFKSTALSQVSKDVR